MNRYQKRKSLVQQRLATQRSQVRDFPSELQPPEVQEASDRLRSLEESLRAAESAMRQAEKAVEEAEKADIGAARQAILDGKALPEPKADKARRALEKAEVEAIARLQVYGDFLPVVPEVMEKSYPEWRARLIEELKVRETTAREAWEVFDDLDSRARELRESIYTMDQRMSEHPAYLASFLQTLDSYSGRPVHAVVQGHQRAHEDRSLFQGPAALISYNDVKARVTYEQREHPSYLDEWSPVASDED